MKLSEINEYAQTVAALFAIAGIVFVGIQVQQSNRFAESDFIADFYSGQINLYSMAIDSDIYATVAKSIESPNELSLDELLELDVYYTNLLLLMEKPLKSGSVLGIVDDAIRQDQLDNYGSVAKSLFPGDFGRMWIENSAFFGQGSLDGRFKAALLEGLNDPAIEARDVRLMRIMDAARG